MMKILRVLILSLLGLSFAACVPGFNGVEPLDSASSLPSDGTGSPVAKVSVQKSGTMANQTYILELLKEVFDSSAYPNSVDNFVTTLGVPNVYGLACDVASSSSDKLCSGDRVTGTTAPIATENSTVRQLNMLLVCETVLGQTNSVKAAAEKIGELTAGNPNEITATNMPKIFGLFYRSRDISSTELQAYLDFNTTLKNAPTSMSLTNRWKSVLVMLCESPDWQIF